MTDIQIPELIDGSEDDDESMTPAEVLSKLEETWMNEQFSPDLLEPRVDLVDCMLDQIHEMEQNIRAAKRGDFRVSIHRLEIDRIRYVLSSYLRSRLQKIEKYTAHILDQESRRPAEDSPHLTPDEYTFAKEYLESRDTHFKSLVLKHMPPNLQGLDPKQTAVRPNMDSYVFLRVNENTDGVLVEEETMEAGEEIVDLEKDDQHLMRYQPIAALVSSALVSLI